MIRRNASKPDSFAEGSQPAPHGSQEPIENNGELVSPFSTITDESEASFADYDEANFHDHSGETDRDDTAGDQGQPDSESDLPEYKAITNVYRFTTEKGDQIVRPLPMQVVLTTTLKKTGDWPRRVDSALFVHDADAVSWITSPAALFGYFANVTGPIDWHKLHGCVSKEEAFHEFRRTSTQYQAVENYPHHPPMASTYYAHGELPKSDGSKLQDLLDRFSPATPIDRDLLQASLMTLVWGGRPGCRPAFVVTADTGRGKGKSKFAELAASIVGGVLSFSNNEDIGKIKTRLLSAEGMACRVCLLDNIKTQRFSWSDLEGMITAPVISGNRHYVGEGRRPNTLVWYLTLNGPSLSTDMAQRSVIIKIGEPKRSGKWEDEAAEFIQRNRWEIIADLVSCLKADPFPLLKFSRWSTWENAVLNRLPEPNEAQKVILERQGEVDGDVEEADLIQDFFANKLDRLGYAVVIDQVFIPTDVVTDWFNSCQKERHKPTAVTRFLNQLHSEGRLSKLKASPGRAHGRGFIWTGEDADLYCPILTDLRDRLAQARAANCEG